MASVNKEQVVNTFTKSMNKDIDLSILPKESYLHAQNFRLVTNEGSSTTALEVIEGNDLLASTLPSGVSTIGYTTVRDEIIIFATDNTTSYIYLGILSSTDILSLTLLYQDSVALGRLNFSTSYPIKAMGRYETATIKKVYWTDNHNSLRFCNYADPLLSTFTATKFDMIADFDQSPIVIDSIGAGSLGTGMVQYSYQLYNLNGTETQYLSPSYLIPLGPAPQTGNDVLFTGSNKGTSAGKSIAFHIAGLDTNFNRIRIVRIFHDSYTDIPVITIIEEAVLNESTMYFVDNGSQNIAEITLEDFAFINYNFTCKELETKNNILFAGNVTESTWDLTNAEFDARAYRFNSFGIARIYEDGTSNYIDFNLSQLNTHTIPTYSDVPETHDCYNKFNEAVDIHASATAYKYKGNGVTLGGQGLNVSYTFEVISKKEYGNLSTVTNEDLYDGSANSLTISTRSSHMRDEIYAYALVLRNTKGQASYAKWIADIRFPSIIEGDAYATSIVLGNVGYVNNLNIIFTINNLPTECVSVQLVRCERTTGNRTIVAQGLVNPTRKYYDLRYPSRALPTIEEYNSVNGPSTGWQYRDAVPATAWAHYLDRSFLTFISPEISYGNNVSFIAGDKLEPISYTKLQGRLVTNTSDVVVNTYDYDFNAYGDHAVIVETLGGQNKLYPSSNESIAITDFKVAECVTDTTSTPITVGSTAFLNYVEDLYAPLTGYTPVTMKGPHGTCGVVSIAYDMTIGNTIDPSTPTYEFGNKYIIANYKRYIKPYGGASYEARNRRSYIPVTNIIDNTNPTTPISVTVTTGDTFITFFEFQRVMVHGIGNVTADSYIGINNQVVIFPVESSINTRWQTNKTFTQEYFGASTYPLANNNALLIQEGAGEWIRLVNSTTIRTYRQPYDLYSYNAVFSKQNNTIQYFPKQFDIPENNTFDCRVIASETKINGEESDSWLKFKLLSFIDVDSKYGKLNSLKTYNNNLLFWQDKGFGTLSVNTRSLITDPNNSSAQLSLGTGGILDRYDYTSTEIGNISQYGVVVGKTGVYWFDSYNKTFYKYADGLQPLSKIKGIQSYLNDFSDKETICIGVHDTKFTENIFTLTNNLSEKTTIAYNEIIDGFTSFYSYTPDMYIVTFDGKYITPLNNTFYLHNSGDRSVFYGTIYSSYITYVANANYTNTKVFDSIEYKTKSMDGTIELFNDKFSTLSIYNSKQYSGVVAINSTNTTKREGSFHTVLPRNIVNVNIESDVDMFNVSNQNASRLFRERIRDKYAIITLTYNNTNGYALSVPYIVTNYRISYR